MWVWSCRARRADFSKARIEFDPARLTALDPTLDVDTIRAHLDAIPVVCAGGAAAGEIGLLSQRERFHWITAPRSAVIQFSPVHTGRCADLDAVLEHLMETMVRPRRG
jgi:hypothetical protein